MTTQQKKEPIYVTPAGLARYPHLNAPDTKFNAAGVYRVDLVLTGDDAAKLAETIDRSMEASFATAKADPKNKGKKVKLADAPYSVIKDDDGNDTPDTKFGFKMTASGKRKDGTTYTARPMIMDTKNKLVKDVKIGGGSKIKVAYSIYPFYTALVGAGVSLRLKQVQVLDLVEWSGGKSAFGEEEGSYEASEQQAEETTTPEGAATPVDASDEKDF